MRDGIIIFGIILLIIRFISLVFGIIAYGNYTALVNAYGGLGLLSKSYYNKAENDYNVGISGIIAGGIFIIIGIVLTIVGLRGKPGK